MPDSPVTASIWGGVSAHGWKYAQRPREVDGIICHFTGSGQPYAADMEYRATINWFLSPNNRVTQDGVTFAGMSSYVVGPRNITEVLPDEWMPRFSSQASDTHAISIEFARAGLHMPWDPDVIANGAKLIRWIAAKRPIELRRVVGHASDYTWTGLIGHQDTYQGRAQGKSDPGEDFWPLMLAALQTEEDGMTKEEIEALVNERIDKALAHQFPLLLKAAFTGGFTSDEAKAAIAETKAALVDIPSAGGVLPAGLSAERIGEALKHGAKAAAGYLANAAQKDNGG